MKKISKKFLKMSEIYRLFSLEWKDYLDFSDKSLREMYDYESSGVPIENAEKNGFLAGKQQMDINIEMWLTDIKDEILFEKELYDDPKLPNWWLDKILK